MSAPFNGQLTAGPRGRAFVWVADQEGSRNLWLATDAGTATALPKGAGVPGSGERPGPAEGRWRVTELTHSSGDDGQEIGEVSWAPDGSAVAFVRGGDFEFPAQAAPNPALLPEGVTQEIWLAPVDGGQPRRIAEGREPAIAPDGHTMAFVRKDQVWVVDLRAGGAAGLAGAGAGRRHAGPARVVAACQQAWELERFGSGDGSGDGAGARVRVGLAAGGSDLLSEGGAGRFDAWGEARVGLASQGRDVGQPSLLVPAMFPVVHSGRSGPSSISTLPLSGRPPAARVGGRFGLADAGRSVVEGKGGWMDDGGVPSGGAPGMEAGGEAAPTRDGTAEPHLLFEARGRQGALRWSPDSRRVAFVRIAPNVTGYLYGARREGPPWSMVVADAETGRGRVVWRAAAGRGSVFRGVPEKNQILWAEGDRIVFPWERDGWTHLYAVRVDRDGGEPRVPQPAGGAPGVKGGQAPGLAPGQAGDAPAGAPGGRRTEDDAPTPAAVLLTPGAFEVEHLTLSPDGRTVVYDANESAGDALDADRRHVWQVPVAGGVPRRLTGGDGIEVAPAVAADGTVAVLRSDARVPVRPAVVAAGGVLQDVAPELVPRSFPAAAMVVPQAVLLPAADGLPLHGQLFLPPGGRPGERHPAVVFFHGGSRRQMLLGWNPMLYYSNAYAENQYLASRGYVVLSVNYRSGTGYGMEFREALGYGPTGASEYNDVLGAGLYLRGRADVDPKRIGAWGGSYGGYLTALGLARASDLFAAGVDMHGVHDWNLERSFAEPEYRADWDQHAAETAWASSPLASVKGWRSPVLLMQGDDDRNVAFANTVQLAETLREQGTPVEEHVFPDEVHDFLLHRTWVEAYRREAEFFAHWLGGGR